MVVYIYEDKIYHCMNQYVPGIGIMTYKKRVDHLKNYVFYDHKDVIFWIDKGKLYKEKYIKTGNMSDNEILIHDNQINTLKQFVITESLGYHMLVGITYNNQIMTATLNPYHKSKIKIFGQPKEESIEVGYVNYRLKTTTLENVVSCFSENCDINTKNINNIRYLLGTYKDYLNVDQDDILMTDKLPISPSNYKWIQHNKYFATKHKKMFADDILEINERYMMVEWKDKQFIYTDEDELFHVKHGSKLYKHKTDKNSN